MQCLLAANISVVGIFVVGLVGTTTARVDAAGNPQLRIDAVSAPYLWQDGGVPEVQVPVIITNEAADSNFVQVEIFYDSTALAYKDARDRVSEWRHSPVRFGPVSVGHLRGVFLRDTELEVNGAERPVFTMTFVLRDRLAADPSLLYESTPISFNPIFPGNPPVGSSTSFIGRSTPDAIEWRYTELLPGSVTTFYQNFVEIGSGRMTRRQQSFSVPLYLTSLSETDVVYVGVDYDELILHKVRSVHGDEVISHEQSGGEANSARFTLELVAPETDSGLFLRSHVADLVFYFDGQADVDRFRITPYLKASPDEVPPNEGWGAANPGSTSVPGCIGFAEDQFIRGNIEGEVPEKGRYSPSFHSAFRIVRHLFRTGEPLPCKEAADVNDSGEVDVSDAILLLNYLFRSGRPPSLPYPYAGTDSPTSPDYLGCDQPLPYFEAAPPCESPQ